MESLRGAEQLTPQVTTMQHCDDRCAVPPSQPAHTFVAVYVDLLPGGGLYATWGNRREDGVLGAGSRGLGGGGLPSLTTGKNRDK